MQEIASENPGKSIKKAVSLFALFLSLEFATFSHAAALNFDPAGAVSSKNIPAPPGVKVLAQLPLQGPANHMFVQWEHGSTYLYIERDEEHLTTVDITKKQSLRIVDHQPAPVIAPHYEQADGGLIEVLPQPAVRAGVDNVRDRGTLSVLQADDPRDAQLLRLFGQGASNLIDRDRGLVFFASPTRLLILEDRRWYGIDYSIN
jgi:hypothetical protein